MNIDISKMECIWYEDQNGERLDSVAPDTRPSEFGDLRHKDGTPLDPNEPVYYHACFPCQMTETVSVWDFKPKNWLERILFKSSTIKQLICRKRSRKFTPLFDASCTYRGMSDCIVAMVNSGDYTLEQAIWIMCNACERCSNVLLYKYTDGKAGYPEKSDEWYKARTLCDFCKG